MSLLKPCVVRLVMFFFVAAGVMPGAGLALAQEGKVEALGKSKELMINYVQQQEGLDVVKKNSLDRYFQIVTNQEADSENPLEYRVVGSFERRLDEDEIDRSLISDYWIGVQCERAGSAVYSPKEAPEAELKIDGGMKILAVTEGGAAEEAGLREGDVLLKFASKKMDSVNDLYAAIGETQDKETGLLIIRDGELKSLPITPKKRPEPEVNEPNQNNGLWQIEDAIQHELGGRQLPKGYRLRIELAQGEDVIVTVSKGKESWSADANSVDKLPNELQSLASGLISKCQPVVTPSTNVLWGTGVEQLVLPQSLFHHSPLVINNHGKSLIRIDERLQALTKAVEELKKRVED